MLALIVIFFQERISMLLPNYIFDKIYDIPKDFFKNLGINTLLLDADNTLAGDGEITLDLRVIDWVDAQKQLGLRPVIFSNNNRERLKPLAKALGIGCIYSAKKPLICRIKNRLDPKSTAIIGDQIFTDVLCAKLFGCVSVKVAPIAEESGISFKIRRRMEASIIQLYFIKRRK